MEKIGNIGWFITNEEKCELETIIERLGHILNLHSEKKNDLSGTEPCTTPYDQQPIEINKPCPQCPWKNPADWTWRPWQAPWYTSPTEWKFDDGDWWRHVPYCTSSTDDPNVVKESKTNDIISRLKGEK